MQFGARQRGFTLLGFILTMSLVISVIAGAKPYFINRILVGQTSSTTGWITVNASAYVPAGAIAVILSTEINGWGPDGGVPNARTLMREYGKTVGYSLVTYRCSAGDDWCASNNQGTYPIDAARRFQWAQTGTGIVNGSVRIYIEGYIL